jgi:hypothetical protein
MAVALAPILGFAGIAVGAWQKDRSDRKNAIRTDRRKLYSQFLALSGRYSLTLGTKAATAYRTERAEKIHDVNAEMRELETEATQLIQQIDLLGSKRAADAAYRFLELQRDFAITCLLTLKTGFDRDQWVDLSTKGLRIGIDFRNAALKDLGHSRRERVLRTYRGGPMSDETRRQIQELEEQSKITDDMRDRIAGLDYT